MHALLNNFRFPSALFFHSFFLVKAKVLQVIHQDNDEKLFYYFIAKKFTKDFVSFLNNRYSSRYLRQCVSFLFRCSLQSDVFYRTYLSVICQTTAGKDKNDDKKSPPSPSKMSRVSCSVLVFIVCFQKSRLSF